MMKPTHPVELLACAIATEEGWFVPNSVPWLRRNPGDLRFAGQLGATRPPGQMPPPEPIAQFPDAATGIVALFRQLWLMVGKGMTVRQIIGAWAPPIENDTDGYLQNVLDWTMLPADTPVKELLPPLVALNGGPRT